MSVRDRITARQALRIGLFSLQWICLTVAMGALMVRTEPSVEGLIGGQFDLSYVLLGAFVAGLLLGLSIPRPLVLYPLTILMCVGAGTIFVSFLFSPTWTDITVRTTALENFATTRAVLYGGLMLAPAGLGALLGNLVSGIIGPYGEILPADDDSFTGPSWWETRGE